MKKVRNSKASISINSCPELSKTWSFPVGIVKNNRNCCRLSNLRSLSRPEMVGMVTKQTTNKLSEVSFSVNIFKKA